MHKVDPVSQSKQVSRTVCLVYRKPTQQFFSIEKVFEQVSGELVKTLPVRSVQVPFYSSSLLYIARNIWSLRKERAAVFHITGDIHYAVFAFPARQTILTIHDCVFMHSYKGIKKWVLYFLFLKWPVYRSRVVTTISEKSRQEIIKYTGCRPDKVIVVSNPAPAGIFFQSKPFNEQKPVLLFIGSTPNKNLVRVAEALQGINCTLRIIGRVTAIMQQQLQYHGIDYSASADLTEEELAGEYVSADIILFPSLYEGFGLPIVEGQRAGRPVITSNISPMKEVSGKGACLVDPYDPADIRKAIITLVEDIEYRELLVKNGFENVKRFTADTIAARYNKIYEQVISATSR